MATKIRLARHGKKGKPFFHIVIADSRSPRDGRFIEKIGTYNPTSNPAVIDINFEKALSWVDKGAQPTDTCRAILSYKGVLYKHHLNRGVVKGALTQEQADAKFEKWLAEKEGKIDAKRNKLAGDKAADAKKRLEEEAKIRAEREKALAEKEAAATAEETATEAAAEEAPATEAPAAEAPAEENPEA